MRPGAYNECGGGVIFTTCSQRGKEFSLPQIQCSVVEGAICPRLRRTAHAQNEYSCDSFDKLILASIYTQTSAKFLILLKKAQVIWMCIIISNNIYTAHHNSLGLCHQLKIRHLCGTLNFLTGRPSVFVWGPEACLFMIFMERCALYEGKLYLREWELGSMTIAAEASILGGQGGGGGQTSFCPPPPQ